METPEQEYTPPTTEELTNEKELQRIAEKTNCPELALELLRAYLKSLRESSKFGVCQNHIHRI